MRGIVFLDHLDGGAAVLCDLVDIGAFHEAQTDVGMSETVSGSRLTVAVGCQVFFTEDRSLAAYKDFLALWKDADPDIPILKEAKAEYAKLQ
jgi:hypothetical protein